MEMQVKDGSMPAKGFNTHERKNLSQAPQVGGKMGKTW
jgi:hypothetical protein